MSNTNIGRRSFTGLALVAAGGLVVGSRIVNAQEKDKKVDLKSGPEPFAIRTAYMQGA